MMDSDLVEQKLVLEGIYLKYGYDFRNYAEASFARRLDSILKKFNCEDSLDLLKKVLREPLFFRRVLSFMTVSTTELFRDPEAFKTLREKVFPVLKTYPHLNIWVAGCSTGEEVYSLSILLQEENMDKRTTIYATDINPQSLEIARKGVYSLQSFQAFAKNYTLAGGQQAPSDYYSAEYSIGRFHSQLRENVIFEEHNLVSDGVFKEMHLILCRNVLIYFNRNLQDRVLKLFCDSLVHRGFLVLGNKETTKFSVHDKNFSVVDSVSRVFQKSRSRSAGERKNHEA